MFINLCLETCDVIERNRDYGGNDLSAGGKHGRIPKIFKTADECREACVAVKDCAGFVFVKSDISNHNCAIKSKWDQAKGKESNCCDSGRVTEECRSKGIIQQKRKISKKKL